MKTHVFGGKRYKIKDLPESNFEDGECDSPERLNKAIHIKKSLTGQVRLETLIHEALHACNWYWDEEGVDYSAKDISGFLWRDGWRRTSQENK